MLTIKILKYIYLAVSFLIIATVGLAKDLPAKSNVQPPWNNQESISVIKIMDTFSNDSVSSESFNYFMQKNFGAYGKFILSQRPGHFAKFSYTKSILILSLYELEPSSCFNIAKVLASKDTQKLKYEIKFKEDVDNSELSSNANFFPLQGKNDLYRIVDLCVQHPSPISIKASREN